METQQGSHEKFYDLTHLFTLVNNDKTFVTGLVEIFINTIPPMCSEMVNASKDKNWEEVGKIAHKLKPTIETMRIQKIHELLKFIEKNVKESTNLETVEEYVNTASDVLFVVANKLKLELNTNFGMQ